MILSLRRSLALATLIATVGLTTAANAGITSVTSSGGSQSVALAFTGTLQFDGTSYLGATITDSVTSVSPATLTFSYSGADYATGLRPVIDFTNNTGAALTGLTVTLGTSGTSLFGFYQLGSSPNAMTFNSTATLPDSGAAVSIPVTIAAGATEAIYVPVNVTNTTGSFTLTISPTSIPEPSSLIMTGLASAIGLGFWGRKRRTKSA